jgi:hypothetical protein
VIIVDVDRDLYTTRHVLHLNAHGKEEVANKIAAVVNKLFSQKVSPAIVLKWIQQEGLTSYLTEVLLNDLISLLKQEFGMRSCL